MKRLIFIIALILSVAQFAFGDDVFMTDRESLEAFDMMIRQDKQQKSVKEDVPQGNVGTLIKDEANKLKNEGSQGRESQLGKWVVEQRKNGRTSSEGAKEAKGAKQIREDGPSKGKGKDKKK